MRTALLVALCLTAYGLSARADDEDEGQAEEAAPAPRADAIDAAEARGSSGAGLGADKAERSRPGASHTQSGGGGGGGQESAHGDEDAPAAVGKPIVTTMQAARSEAMGRRGFNHANPVFASGTVYSFLFITPAAQSAKVPVGEYHWSPVPSRNVCENLSASISQAPGDLKGVCRLPGAGTYGDLRWTYGGKGCSLSPGKSYYFNLKCEKCVVGTGDGYAKKTPAADCENISVDDVLNWIAKPK